MIQTRTVSLFYPGARTLPSLLYPRRVSLLRLRRLAFDQFLGLAAKDFQPHAMLPFQRLGVSLLLRLPLDHLVQPLAGLGGMAQAVVRHRQEQPVVQDVCVSIEPLNSFLERPGAVEHTAPDSGKPPVSDDSLLETHQLGRIRHSIGAQGTDRDPVYPQEVTAVSLAEALEHFGTDAAIPLLVALDQA